jgi:glycosyltransferase involved in cell wall biosynthesis
VVVLTKDEAERLPRALARVPAGVPVFVLDAESGDGTADIARAHGAEVEVRAWRGYVDARRHALARVRTPYAFMLDADELISDDLRDALARPLDGHDGYRVRRVTMLAGRAVRAAGWSAERLVRCVRVDRARLVTGSVGGAADLHERWVVDGTVGDLPGMLVHDSYPTVASYHQKFRRYTEIEAAAVGGSPFGLLAAAATMPLRLLWLWLRHAGWRDGWRGVFVAWYSAWYPLAVQLRALRAR